MTPDLNNFFIAITGAAAALTGLIFVGVSINLARILSTPALPVRALESLILLLNIVVTSSICLVPQSSVVWFGVEISFVAMICWTLTLVLDLKMLRTSERVYLKHATRNIILSQLSLLPFVTAGVLLLRGTEGATYWLVPGILFSLVKAVMDAWVLLIEIHR